MFVNPPAEKIERLLRSALNHFDRILAQREFQSLMQQEMVRLKQSDGGALPLFFRTVFKPLIEKLQQAVIEGIDSGELCPMDPLQAIYSIFGPNVFYFLSAPMMQLALPFKPFDTHALHLRRIAAVQFLGMALFTDRAHGATLADRVLADMPMPQPGNPPASTARSHARRNAL